MLEANESSIPVLTDVLVPGNPALARAPAEPAEPHTPAGTQVFPVPTLDVPAFELPTAFTESSAHADPLPVSHQASAAALAPQPALSSVIEQASADADAQRLAERLQVRVTNYLTGEGRGLIEARCRDALQDHTAWLVGQITREVALALETEVAGWVREAVAAELAGRHDVHRGGSGPA